MRTIERDIVGGFIITADKRLLLGQSRKGGVYKDAWVIPGGGIDDGETKEQALAREILEETGLTIDKANISLIDGNFSGQSEKTLRDTGERVLVNMKFYDFKVELPDIADKYSLSADDDLVNLEWVSLDELDQRELSAPTAERLQILGYI